MKQLLNLKIDGSVQRECIDITATGLEFNQYILDEEDGFCLVGPAARLLCWLLGLTFSIDLTLSLLSLHIIII